jgi:cyclin-A
MADKENAALAAVGPRLTRAAAKRAAAEAAAVAGKRKRVALGEFPTLTNAPAARPAKKTKPAEKEAALKPAAAVPVPSVPAPPSPPRAEAVTVAEAEPESSASSYSPPRPAAVADPSASASSSSPPCAVAEPDPSFSVASSPPPPRAAAADAQLCPAYASDIYTYLRTLEVLLPTIPFSHFRRFPPFLASGSLISAGCISWRLGLSI